MTQKFALLKGTRFYRIRRNPQNPILPPSYDAPPTIGQVQRPFQSAMPVMYGAFDVESDDEICIATIETLSDLEVVDLGVYSIESAKRRPMDESIGFSESSDAIDLSTTECRIISERAFEGGIRAIQFPSVFSQVLIWNTQTS